MWLRAFTTLMLLAVIALLVTRPLIVGPVPHRPAKRAEALVYSERALGFTALLIVSLVGAGCGAIKLVRLANAEYKRLAMENMQSLIEGAMEDHRQKTETKNEPAE